MLLYSIVKAARFFANLSLRIQKSIRRLMSHGCDSEPIPVVCLVARRAYLILASVRLLCFALKDITLPAMLQF